MSIPMNRTGSSSIIAAPHWRVAEPIKAAFSRQPVVWLVALLVAIVHIATAGRNDAQRNELYFLVCGRHPDFGYVDQPPLVPLIAAATQVFGVNIWMLRLPATLAAVGLVLLCAAFARLLGGGSRAAVFAAIAAGIAPGLAGLGSHLTTSTFEPIAWTGAAYLLTRAILRDTRFDLVWVGALAGLAMEAKWGIAVWLVALGVGVAVTPARRMLLWWQLWLGIAVAAVLFAPNLSWQWWHGWPFFQVILPHLESQKNYTGPFWRFEWRQAWSMNIALAPLWLAGTIGPFIDRRLAAARFLAIGFPRRSIFFSAAPTTICSRSIRPCLWSARCCASGSTPGSRVAGSRRQLASARCLPRSCCRFWSRRSCSATWQPRASGPRRSRPPVSARR
jgi:4-amino-4-deoxy-L-arabinose transferase-like glycosyltransferase